jgi:chemotaxis signal transduction protein
MKEDLNRERMEAVWRERAQRLSQRPVQADGGVDAFPVIVLEIGKERYGIDLDSVTEVLAPLRVTPVPGSPAVFSGVINVHGEIRPVMDLRRFLRMETIENDSLRRVILLCKDGWEMGLEIDGVEQIRWIAPGEFRCSGDSAHSAHIKGSTNDLLMLLSTEALFAELHTGVTN